MEVKAAVLVHIIQIRKDRHMYTCKWNRENQYGNKEQSSLSMWRGTERNGKEELSADCNIFVHWWGCHIKV
jgi:hypothetical protein